MGNNNSSKFQRLSKRCLPSSTMSSSVIVSNSEKRCADQSLKNKTKSMYELSTTANEAKNVRESKENSNHSLLVKNKKSELVQNNINETIKYSSDNEKKKNKLNKRQVCRSQTVKIQLDENVLDIDKKNNGVRPIIKSSSKAMPMIHSSSALNFFSNIRSDNSSITTNNTDTQLSKKSSLRRKSSSKSKDKIDSSLSLIKKGLKKDAHPVSNLGREIIISCFENPHADLGQRVIGRLYEKRIDYQKFIISFGKQNMRVLADQLKLLMENVVANLDNISTIENLSKTYGETHVDLKVFGFKPDFWVGLADSLTVECVILDQATHSPTDVVAAWSQLIATIFSNIRDGYYGALRLHRIASRKNMLAKQTLSNDISTKPYNNEKDFDLSDLPKTLDNNSDLSCNFIDFSHKKGIELTKNENQSTDHLLEEPNHVDITSPKPTLTRWKAIND